MSAASQTKIFGIRLGVDPKLLLAGLFVIAALLYWFNSSGGEQPGTSTAVLPTSPAVPSVAGRGSVRPVRRQRSVQANRGIFRIRQVNGQDGSIDPTLRLDLLSRLQSIQPGTPGRSLFEAEKAATMAGAAGTVPTATIVPRPLPPTTPTQAAPSQPVASIPLKYYGFENPAKQGSGRRGLFLDNDNVLVAGEGELVNHRYLVVELTPNSARMEDTEIKQGETLPVVPEATEQ